MGKGKGKARGEPEVPNVTGDCTMLRFARTVEEDASSSDEGMSLRMVERLALKQTQMTAWMSKWMVTIVTCMR